MRVFVEGMEFRGYHGVFEEERREGRRLKIDLEVEVDEEGSTKSDELEETLDYRRLAEIVTEVVEGPSRFLVEKLAGEIVATTLERHPSVCQATVRVRKKAPDVVGQPRWVGVELSRRRSEHSS